MKLEDFRARVMIATPCYTAQTHCAFTQSLLISQLDCMMRGIFVDWIVAPGFSLVQFARNYLVQQFLDNDTYTHLLWIDSDISWQPDAIRKMVDRKLDAVCAVYTTKSIDNPIFPYMSTSGVVDGLQEASRVPGGFLLVSRAAVEAVVAKCRRHKLEHDGVVMTVPYVFDLVLNGEDLLGEDYVFSARLRDAGYKIFVEVDTNLTHIGLHEWPANLARTLEHEASIGKSGQGTPEAQALNQEHHAAEDAAIKLAAPKKNKSWE